MSDKNRTAKQQVEDMIAKKVGIKKKAEAFDKTTIEYAVFEFIQKMEELAQLTNASGHDVIRAHPMIKMVYKDLDMKIRKLDYSAKWTVVHSEHQVEGVRWPKLESVDITWTEKFAQANNIDQTLHITVAEIIMRYLL